MAWTWGKGKEVPKEEDDGLPKEIKEQLELAKSTSEEFKAYRDKSEKTLSAMDEYLETQRKEREEREKKRTPPPASKTQEEIDAENQELSELLLTNPREAHRRMNERTDSVVLQVRADALRRETFEDEERFPYYSGEIKAEVNKIIATQSLAFQNDPTALENTYFTVVGKRAKEINEGKIKDRFAGANSSRTSGKSDDGLGDNKKTVMETDELRRAAKTLGIPLDDYKKMMQEELDAEGEYV